MGRKIDVDALIDWLEDGYDEDHAFAEGLLRATSEEDGGND